MGYNKPYERHFITVGGLVKKTGGSLNLTKGQLAIVDAEASTAQGAQVVSSFAGKPKDKKVFEIRLGIPERAPNKTRTNHSPRSSQFSLNEVRDLRVSAPKSTVQKVDEVIIGYDGITPGSGFKFKTGDSYFQVAVELSGDPVSFLGGGVDTEIAVVRMEVPFCDPFNDCVDCDNCSDVDCKSITLEAIERLRRKQLTGGSLIGDLVEITPIFSCDNPVSATLIPFTYYTLSLCDTGSDEALAFVQAQYDSPVIRTNRVGATSTYQVLTPDTEGAPNDYNQTLPSLIKGCANCPAGYTATPEGLLYAFTIEDDGTDQSALITALPNYVATTIERTGNYNGVGFYTAVFSTALTDAQITTFVTGAAPRTTATVELVGTVKALCENSTITQAVWVAGETCNAVSETYEIILPDDECGNSRLIELQGAYPDLTIAIAQELTGQSQRTVTLTGTSGTANVTIQGVDYLATFATSLTVTATNFVTTHAAAIALATGAVVTSNGANIIITDATTGFPTVAVINVSGNLAGTVAAIVALTQNVVGGCQTKYSTTVISNLVCEECDPIYEDFYKTVAPNDFGVEQWTVVSNTTTQPNGNCECGIRIKAKPFHIVGDEALRDLVGFTETSTQVRVSAGYPEEIAEGIGRLPSGAQTGRYLSRKVDRTHLGGNLRYTERESQAFWQGYPYRKDYLGRILTGELPNVEDDLKQYVQYTLTVAHETHTQGFARRAYEDVNYEIWAEVGRHQDVEDLLNNLAANAGIKTVSAFGA